MSKPGSPLPPWHSERELDADIARRAIERCFPELAAQKVRYLHEGWDSQAFSWSTKPEYFAFPSETAIVPAPAQ